MLIFSIALLSNTLKYTSSGCDDYMSKSFETMKLLARIKAHLRRNRMLKTQITLTTIIN